jgi:hypothetical protein
VKHAGRDAEECLNYLTSLKDIQIKEKQVQFFGDLLDTAGYNWIIADTQEKQDEIKKYFASGEELCTFGTNRYQKYHIVNVWKKDVDSIKREETPVRDGPYGTSVMSIQISKNGGFISIKNRYNHTVACCDNTLNSNPDNIIDGLAYALKNHFNVDFSSQRCEILGNYHIICNQILKYNYEINGCFIGETAFIKDGKLVEIDKGTELILDYFLLNLNTKKVTIIPDNITDSFPVALENELKDKKLRISKNPDDVEQEGEFLIIKEY